MPALQASLRTFCSAAWASYLAFALLSGVAASQAATYYIDYVGGNDSNSGASKSAPWKHCPAMEPFGGRYNHQDGDRFIFKGGVTWPRAAVPLYITEGGAPGNHDYYGVDQTWYSSGAWTRPVFTAGGLSFVNHTSVARENMIRIVGSGSQYITFDNLKLTQWAASNEIGNDTDSYGINVYQSGFINVTNCYIGDWEPISTSAGGGCVVGSYQTTGPINVSDCTLEGPLSINPSLVTAPGGFTAGAGVKWVTRVERCDISLVSQGAWGIDEFWDNRLHDSCHSFQDGVHENGIRFHGDSHTRGNLVWNIHQGVGIFIIPGWGGHSPCRAWTYNNVFWNLPQCNVGSGDTQTTPNQNESWFVNNIIVDQLTSVGTRDGATQGPVVRANNLFINDSGSLTSTSLLKSDGSPAQEINTNNVLITHAQAAAFGMTLGNGYKPTGEMSQILNKGLNFSGNVLGVSSLSPLRFSIDHDNVPRPQGSAWDIGAYEYSQTRATTSPSPTPSPTPLASPTPSPTPLASPTSAGAPVGVMIDATAGTILAPFVVASGYISQSIETTNLTGGKAVYRFNVIEPGEYAVVAVVNTLSEGSNSFFVNVDAEPLIPASTWHIPVTSGFETRVCSWQGSGSWDKPELAPKYFQLSAGPHEVIVRGRERNTALKAISLVKRPSAPTGVVTVD